MRSLKIFFLVLSRGRFRSEGEAEAVSVMQSLIIAVLLCRADDLAWAMIHVQEWNSLKKGSELRPTASECLS